MGDGRQETVTKASVTPPKRVEDMPVFQDFYRISLAVESASKGFPSEFRWLRSQVLRSSESVCANMAEGFYSQYTTEYVQCLYRCRREARESLVHLSYATDTGLISRESLAVFTQDFESALQQLGAVVRSLEQKMQTYGKGKPSSSILREDDGGYWTDSDSSSPINHHP
jgi:four helix bundle protein